MSYRIDISWTNIDGVQDGSSSMALGEVNGSIPETLNDIDYYDFTVYYGSSNWEHFAADLTYVKLWNSKANDYVWYGRVASVIDGLSEEGMITKQIHCESEIAYLCDSVCDVQDVLTQMQTYHPTAQPDTVIADNFLIAMLDLHSQTVGTARRIYPPNGIWNSGGYFEVSGSTGYPQSTINNSLGIDTGSTFSALKALRDKQGWDIWCEHTDGKTYLKVGLAGSREQGTSGDVIVLAENMRSLSVERAPVSEGRVTRIIPLGGVGADGKRLNIAAVNNYERYLANQTLVAKYGNIDMVVLYDDLVDDGNMSTAQLTAAKNELKSRGQQRLALLTGGITAIKCRAVDLYEAGYSPSYTFKVGGRYAFDCSYLGLDEYSTDMRLYQKTTDLAEPYNPELTFILPSSTYKTQVTNERLRIQQKFYAQAKAQADRLDNTSVKKTTSSAYDPTTANPGTVYYVDKGDGTGELMLDGTSYGGGGSGTTVENAAVLIPTNFHDYVINEQLIVDIQPPNMVYYGNMPAFAIIQGHYCVMSNVQSTSGRWTGYTQDLFDAIVANKDKFGVQYGTETSGGWLDKVGSNNYPDNYVYVKTDLNKVTTNASGYQARINFAKYYAANNPPQPSGTDWWEATITHSSSFTPYQSTDINLLAPESNYFSHPLHSYFVVPVITSYTQNNLVKDPFGEVDIDGWLIFATDDGINYGAYMHRTASSSYLRGSVPLISDAEKAFILGISQRTEPTPSNGGA